MGFSIFYMFSGIYITSWTYARRVRFKRILRIRQREPRWRRRRRRDVTRNGKARGRHETGTHETRTRARVFVIWRLRDLLAYGIQVTVTESRSRCLRVCVCVCGAHTATCVWLEARWTTETWTETNLSWTWLESGTQSVARQSMQIAAQAQTQAERVLRQHVAATFVASI